MKGLIQSESAHCGWRQVGQVRSGCSRLRHLEVVLSDLLEGLRERQSDFEVVEVDHGMDPSSSCLLSGL